MTDSVNSANTKLIAHHLKERDEAIPSSWTKSTWGKSTKPLEFSPQFFKPLVEDCGKSPAPDASIQQSSPVLAG